MWKGRKQYQTVLSFDPTSKVEDEKRSIINFCKIFLPNHFTSFKYIYFSRQMSNVQLALIVPTYLNAHAGKFGNLEHLLQQISVCYCLVMPNVSTA